MSTPNISSELNKQLDKLKSYGFNNILSGGVTSGNDFVNSVYTIVQEGQNYTEGNGEQKAQAVQTVVSKILDLISSVGNMRAEAKQEVKKEEQDITKIEQKAENVYQSVQSKIDGITENMDKNIELIKQSLEVISNAGIDVTKKQEEVEAKQAEIEANISILRDSSKRPEDRKKALQDLLGISKEIDVLLADITAIAAQMTEQGDIVNTLVASVQTDSETAANEFANGIGTVQQSMQQEGAEVADVTTSTIKGEGCIVAAEAMKTAEIVPVVGAAAATKAIDLEQGGTELTTGSASNQVGIVKALGSMTEEMSGLITTMNSIGSQVGNASQLIGKFGSTLEPMIESLGSWSQVAEANNELKNAITDYSNAYNISIEDDDNILENTELNDNQEHAQDENINELKFNFDTNLFKKAFEK